MRPAAEPRAADSMQPPLADVVVLDLTTRRAELSGRVLAQLGALVIKVEPPSGSDSRQLPPFENGPANSLYWEAVGSGKRSIVANIHDDADRANLRALLERADILLESFDPGEMASLALGFDDVVQLNPGVIYVSITPYGQFGPDSGSPATELTIEAASGLLGLQGDADRPPVPIGYPQPAFHAGVQAAADALIALHARESSGLGQHLDVSMQAAMVWTLLNATGYVSVTGADPPGTGSQRGKGASPIPGVTLPSIWPCADGFITCSLAGGRVGSTPLQTVIEAAAAEVDVPADISGHDWTGWSAQVNSGALSPETVQCALDVAGGFFARHTQTELMEFGTRHSLLLAAVFDIAGLLNDPQLRNRGFWAEVDGVVRPGAPVRLSRTPMLPPARAPKLGADQHLLHEPLAARASPRGSGKRRPFEGLKVADFSWIGVGPIVAKALADHGATVVHVESPSRPDLLRTIPPFKDNIPGLDRAQFMANFNTSKLGLNLNLSNAAARDVAHDLIRWSDVTLESFTTGTMDRLGLGYEEISREHPDLVMLSTCLRGQTGPQRMYGGYGGQGAALAGIYGVTGWPDRPPTTPWGAYSDFIAPRYGVAAVVSALRHRDRTGQGQHIDLAQVEAAISFIEPLVLDYTINGVVAGRHGSDSPIAAPHGVFPVRGDQRFIALACESTAQWKALCELAPLAEFRSAAYDDLTVRLAERERIENALADWLAEQDGFEVVALLKRAGVPASVVLRPTDLFADPQLTAREFFVTAEHRVMGPTAYDGPVTRFSRTPPQIAAAPCLGQHTNEVLCGLLGYSEARMTELAKLGAFT